jgi:hypothetical protein
LVREWQVITGGRPGLGWCGWRGLKWVAEVVTKGQARGASRFGTSSRPRRAAAHPMRPGQCRLTRIALQKQRARLQGHG